MAVLLNDKESKLYSAFTNNGEIQVVQDVEQEDGTKEQQVGVDKITLQDVVSTPDLVRFIPKVVQVVLHQAIEPDALITQNCFYEIPLQEKTQIQIGAIGAMSVGKVSEQGEYPEAMVNLGSGGEMIALTTEKFGVKLGFSDEVIEESNWPLVQIWLQAAGRAFARHQEGLAIKIIDTFGTDVLDNSNPANAEYGNCSGRDISGAANGTMTLHDLMDMYSYLSMRGFTPDTMIMHPLAWKTFATDPEVREIVLNGATLSSWKMPNGGPSQGWGPTPFSGLGLRTIATGGTDADKNYWPMPNAFTQSFNPLGATFNIPPRYLPTPMKVLVTPYVPFLENGGGSRIPTTNIYMLDSSRCGVFAVRERPTSEEWRDPERDVQFMKLRARYGFAILEQGKSVACARNVVVDRNYVFDNVNQVSLANLNRNSSLV
jgi:hypothetical protein